MKEITPLLIVVIISMLVLPLAGAIVNNNTAWYLQNASKVLNGQGYENKDRVPFLIILASAFKIWGKNVHSASLVTRIFFAIEIILIYLLGRIFYGTAVGLLSSGLVLTSYGVNYVARSIDRDIVLPFFILLFILIYYITLIRSSRIWAVFAGISLGLALVFKETASVCIGLPIGMILLAPKGKRWEYGKLGFWVIGAMVIFLVSLAFFMFHTKDILSMIQYEAIKSKIITFDILSESWAYLFTAGLLKTLIKYYQGFLREVTPLSFLMVFGWIFVFIRGLISKKTSDLILTISVVCFLPIILLTADMGLRLGQTTMVYMLLYVTLATLVVSCSSLLMSYAVKFNIKYIKFNNLNSAIRKYRRLISNLLIVLVAFFLIKAQLFDKNDPTWKAWTKSQSSLAIFSKKPFKIYGRFTSEQQEAAEWLKKNVSKNAKIIADGFTHEALDFFGFADYEIPVFQPTLLSRLPVFSNHIEKRNNNSRPLYFLTYHSFDSGYKKNRIYFSIFEEHIVGALKRENPDYLVISERGLFFRAYFDKAGWAFLKFDNQYVCIYEINLERFEPVTFENVGVNETINEHLIWLEKNYPDKYLLFKEKIESLGLTIDKLKNSKLRFPIGQTY